jgi:hypothetical protein
MLILAAAEPARPYIAASWAFVGNAAAVDSDRQLGRTPRQGNIVVCIYWGDSGSSLAPTVNSAGGWTQFALLPNGGNAHAVGVYREVQFGDTSLLPKPFTSGGSGFSLSSFSSSAVSRAGRTISSTPQVGRATAGATIATTPILTDGVDQLGVIAYANYNQSADPVQSGAITFETPDAWNDGGNYGGWMLVEHLFAAAASSSKIRSTGQATPAAIRLDGFRRRRGQLLRAPTWRPSAQAIIPGRRRARRLTVGTSKAGSPRPPPHDRPDPPAGARHPGL